MQNQKWTFVFLLWVGKWAFGFGPDRWKHWNHSHRNKTRHLPNRNVLAVSLPHKQAFEGRWAGRRTDGRHSRVSTRSRTRTGLGGARTWRLEWVMGSQWKRGFFLERGSLQERCTINSSIRAEKSRAERQKEERRRENHWNKMQIQQLDSHWKPLTEQTTVLVTVDAKRFQLWAQNDDSYTLFKIFAWALLQSTINRPVIAPRNENRTCIASLWTHSKSRDSQ